MSKIMYKLVYNIVRNWPLFGVLPLCLCNSIGGCISKTDHLDTPVMLGTIKNSRRPTSSWNSSSFPAHLLISKYSGQLIHMWSSNPTRWTGQCRVSMNIIWRRKTEARWRQSSHRMPGVSAGNVHIPPWSLKNTYIRNLRDPAYAKFAVIQHLR